MEFILLWQNAKLCTENISFLYVIILHKITYYFTVEHTRSGKVHVLKVAGCGVFTYKVKDFWKSTYILFNCLSKKVTTMYILFNLAKCIYECRYLTKPEILRNDLDRWSIPSKPMCLFDVLWNKPTPFTFIRVGKINKEVNIILIFQ